MSRPIAIHLFVDGALVARVPPASPPSTLDNLFNLFVRNHSPLRDSQKLAVFWCDENGDDILIRDEDDLKSSIKEQAPNGSGILKFHALVGKIRIQRTDKEPKPLADLCVDDVAYMLERLEMPPKCCAQVRKSRISGRLLCLVENEEDLRDCGLSRDVLSNIHARLLLQILSDLKKSGVAARYLRGDGKEGKADPTTSPAKVDVPSERPKFPFHAGPPRGLPRGIHYPGMPFPRGAPKPKTSVHTPASPMKEIDFRQQLLEADPSQQKNMIGEKLYPLVFATQPEEAGEITGMFLEMDNEVLFDPIESSESLADKIDEALYVVCAPFDDD